MSCWSCSPYCGKCKVPMGTPIKCEQCGRFTPAGSSDVCMRCGAKLPELKNVTVTSADEWGKTTLKVSAAKKEQKKG